VRQDLCENNGAENRASDRLSIVIFCYPQFIVLVKPAANNATIINVTVTNNGRHFLWLVCRCFVIKIESWGGKHTSSDWMHVPAARRFRKTANLYHTLTVTQSKNTTIRIECLVSSALSCAIVNIHSSSWCCPWGL
jgi:hypothetical protein